MNRRTPLLRRLAPILSTIIGLCVLGGCGDDPEPATRAAPDRPSPAIASLSPAATDLLLGMGAGDHLVAVSDYDTDERVVRLPRVGAYQSFDFERLAEVRPDVMIVQKDPASLPPGAKQNAEQLGITFYNAKINRLRDIIDEVGRLATLVGEDPEAMRRKFTAALDAGRALPADYYERAAASGPRVLVLLNDELSFAAGRDNYLDDLILNSGGRNAIGEGLVAWPQLDREALLSLEPEAVVLILPDATPAQLAAAEANWNAVADAMNVPWADVTVVTDSYAMIPGWRVVELANLLRDAVNRVRNEARP